MPPGHGHFVLYAYTRCGNDDGNGALAQQANFLTALGLVFVAAYGNPPGNCTPANQLGEHVTKQPASGSFVLSVAGSETGPTVNRNNDTLFPDSFTGPRMDWSFMTPNLLALKPDLAAPQGLTIPLNSGTLNFVGFPRFSPATAVTAGAAALLLQRFPAMTADSVKDALIKAVDFIAQHTIFGDARPLGQLGFVHRLGTAECGRGDPQRHR